MLKKILDSNEKLVRKKRPLGQKDANLTGVCEGLGDYIGINPWYIRLGFVAMTIWMTWVTVPAYLALFLLLPKDDNSQPLGTQLFNKATQQYYQQQKSSSEYATQDLIICSNCQTAVPHDSKFCYNCGAKL